MTTHGKGHHEHPFSHTDAARAQAEAMELARAQALAQLQHVDAQGTSTDEMPAGLARAMGSLGMDPAQMQRGQGPAGARGTFETGTSGPSFGHLYHDGAQPTSTRQSAQRQYAQQLALAQMQAQGYTGEVGDDGPESHAMMRELVGPGQEAASFVRVPFGVPLNMQLPRPMMLMRTGTGMGMGIGISPLGMGMGMMSPGAEMSLHGLGQSLYGLPKQAEGKMDNRSAYVETVEDVSSLFLRATRWRGESAPRRPSIASFVVA